VVSCSFVSSPRKHGFDSLSGIPLVAPAHAHVQAPQQALHGFPATTWQGDVMGNQFGAGDDAWNPEGRKPYGCAL
jgi:hypothetical protein